MVGPFLLGQTIETGFIEAVSEDLCSSNAASAVEKELEVTSMTRGVGVCDGFGVAKRFEERTKCADLISGFRLPFGVGREPKELVYKEGAAEALSRACYPPYTRNMLAKRDAHSPENHRMTTPEDDRL